MRIEICIGSSCHLKGSREVIALFEDNIVKNNLQDKVELVGSFCIGKCSNEGVSVRINNEIYCGVTLTNFQEIFNKYVLSYYRKEIL